MTISVSLLSSSAIGLLEDNGTVNNSTMKMQWYNVAEINQIASAQLAVFIVQSNMVVNNKNAFCRQCGGSFRSTKGVLGHLRLVTVNNT